MNVYFAILTVIFGPLIFMAFLRWLSNGHRPSKLRKSHRLQKLYFIQRVFVHDRGIDLFFQPRSQIAFFVKQLDNFF
jgi:hypothetical protein